MLGRRLAFLDVITNALCAMVLVFFLVISRQFEPPPERVQASLIILAEIDRREVTIGVAMSPPDTDKFQFGNEIEGFTWATVGGEGVTSKQREEHAAAIGEAIAGLGEAAPTRSTFARSITKAPARTTAMGVLRFPKSGCWEVDVYYEEQEGLLHSGPLTRPQSTSIKIWYKGFDTKETTHLEAIDLLLAPMDHKGYCLKVPGGGVTPGLCPDSCEV